jgi:hypothetical protein
MTLKELLEALQKAPPEAMEQEVLMAHADCGSGCVGLHFVESVKFKGLDKKIQPSQIVLVHADLLSNKGCIYPEDDRRQYLSDVSRFRKIEKGATP